MDEIIGAKVLLLTGLITRSAALRYRRLLGMQPVSWRILALLGSRPPTTLNELASLSGIDKSQLSRGITLLVRKGMVSRRASLSDGRAVQISLTARGTGAYATLFGAASRRNEQLLAGISAAQRRSLFKILDIVTDRARALLHEDEHQRRR